MNFPQGATAIVNLLYGEHVTLAEGTDDSRRQLTMLIAQTFAARFGPRWGVKATSKTAPQSKDSIAFDNMDGTFDSWDWQNGTTKAPQVRDGQPPTFPRIGNQFFINVMPHDWLAQVAPVAEPAAPAPPSRDEQLELLGRVLVEVQDLRADQNVLIDALAKTRSDLTDLRLQVAHGLTGNLFGYRIVLKPEA